MTRRATILLGAAALAVALAPALASAQYRGDRVEGKVTQMTGRTVSVDWQGKSVKATVSNSTEVVFSDAGDRKLFPNPSIKDIRPGMGVRFTYGDGTIDKITVTYVPPSRGGSAEPEAPSGGSRDSQFDAWDSDGDGKISAAEWKAQGNHPGNFRNLDRNNDGYLSRSEFEHRDR
jgi:hypothetical protein